jgi:hypothetical protein
MQPYLQIEDEYWYGHYNYWQLVMNTHNGYFNATEMCTFRNLAFEDWINLETSQKQLRELHKRLGCVQVIVKVKKHYECKNVNDLIMGVYLHPDLLPNFISWILSQIQLLNLVNKFDSVHL